MKKLALRLISLLLLASFLTACGGGGGSSNTADIPAPAPGVDSPETPETPEIPETPETPEVPDDPEIPADPDDGAPIDTPPDIPNTAPSATIVFPPALSLTDGATFIVRGTAADAQSDGINFVKVNGVDAVSNDGFASWQATVPLAHGQNTLTVETQDSGGATNPEAASVQILQQSVFLTSIRSGAIDSVNNTLLTADNGAANVVAIDLSTGARAVISGNNRGEGREFGSVLSLEIAPSGGCVTVLPAALRCALMTDNDSRAVVAVDLDTGDRAVISSNTRGSGPKLGRPRSLTASDAHLCPPSLAGASHCALLEDTQLKSLLAINLATGKRVVVASNERGSGPDMIGSSSAILDSNNACAQLLTGVLRCLLMVDSFSDALFAVDLDTGNRAIVSGAGRGAGPVFGFPKALVLDPGHRCAGVLVNVSRCALVLDTNLNAIFAVDLASGDRAIFSNVNRGSGLTFNGDELLLDNLNNRALVVDSNLDSLVTVDLLSGDRGLLPDHRIGSGPVIDFAEGMTRFDSGLCNNLFDGASACALVADGNSSALIAVDLSTGNRAMVSGDERGSGPQFTFPQAVVLGQGNHCTAFQRAVSHCALVLSSDILYAVDLETGDREIVSNENQGSLLGNSIALLNDCISLVLGASHCALVTDLGLGTLMVIDLDTGDRAVVSNEARGVGPSIDFATAVALDDRNPCISVLPNTKRCGLVLNLSSEALFAVDLETGDRAILAGVSRGDGPSFLAPSTMVLDESNLCAKVLSNTTRCALVADEEVRALFAVDLDTGNRAILFDDAGRGAPSLAASRAIVLDNENGFMALFNAQLQALILIDLQTQERVISAWGGGNRAASF